MCCGRDDTAHKLIEMNKGEKYGYNTATNDIHLFDEYLQANFVFLMTNINDYFRFKYPLAMLKSLFIEGQRAKVLIMYDIGRKLHKTAKVQYK